MTARQEAFVREYLIDGNGTQAAIRAGYSPKTAAQIAEQVLRKLEVKAALAGGREELRETALITALDVIRKHIELRDAAAEAKQYSAAIAANKTLAQQIGVFADTVKIDVSQFLEAVKNLDDRSLMVALAAGAGSADSGSESARTH